MLVFYSPVEHATVYHLEQAPGWSPKRWSSGTAESPGCGGHSGHPSMAVQRQILTWQIRHGRCRRPHGWARQLATRVRSRALLPIEVRDWHVVGASRPSALAQRAADEARSTRRGATGSRQAAMRSPRTLQPLALDATWLAPEQRDLFAYMDERIRETQQRILSGAKHTERICADASSTRAWHDSGRCLQARPLPTRPRPRARPRPRPRPHAREACCLSC